MATFTEAVHTVEAMAAIPCLRGGFACFDDDLAAVGWFAQQDNLGTIWAQVPQDPAHAAHAVRMAIHEARSGIERTFQYLDGEEARRYRTAEEREQSYRHYFTQLERLNAAAADEAVA